MTTRDATSRVSSAEYLRAVANAFDPVEGDVQFEASTWFRIRNAIYDVLSAPSATAGIVQVLPIKEQPPATTTSTQGPLRYVITAKFDGGVTKEFHGEYPAQSAPVAQGSTEDEKRLDWCDKRRVTIYKSEFGSHWTVVDEVKAPRYGTTGKTLRETIDAAMKDGSKP